MAGMRLVRERKAPARGCQEEIPFCAGRRRRVGLVEAARAIYDVGRVLHRLHIGTGSPFRARRHLSALSSRHWPPSRRVRVASDAVRTPRSSRRPFSSSRGRTQGHLGVAPSVPRYATRCIRLTASTIDSDLLLSVSEAPNHCTKPRPSRSTSSSTKDVKRRAAISVLGSSHDGHRLLVPALQRLEPLTI